MWERLRFLQLDITGLSENSSRDLFGKKATMKCVYLCTPLGCHNYFSQSKHLHFVLVFMIYNSNVLEEDLI